VIALAREACAAGACLESACGVLGISIRTLQRWTEGGGVKEDGRLAAGQMRTPANKLSPEERQRIVATANSTEFASLPPSQIVPRLADQGEYLQNTCPLNLTQAADFKGEQLSNQRFAGHMTRKND